MNTTNNKFLLIVLIGIFVGSFSVLFAQEVNPTAVPQADIKITVPKADIKTTVPKADIKITVPDDNGIFTLQNPLKVDSIGELLQSLIEIFTYLVIIFAVLMFIWTGFQYVVVASQGDTKKIGELHNRMLWLVIGIAIVIGARVIVEVVINTLSATGAVSPGVIDSANRALPR